MNLKTDMELTADDAWSWTIASERLQVVEGATSLRGYDPTLVKHNCTSSPLSHYFWAITFAIAIRM